MPKATTASASPAPNPFIKQLAANDRQTRDRALSSLRTFLSRNTPFSPLDFQKLWKGLFYSMWSCDKPAPQRRLAYDLSSLVTLLSSTHNFIEFIRAFWGAMMREWSGISSLRMDKFLFLVREYVRVGFEVLSRNQWADEQKRKEYLDVLKEVPLSLRDPKVPNGLRYHVLDVWADELEKVVGEEAGEEVPFEELFEPVMEMGVKSPIKSVRERVGEVMRDERVRGWLGIEDDEEEDEDDEDDEEMDGDEEEEDEDDAEFGGFDD